jgi:hypothetical protein
MRSSRPAKYRGFFLIFFTLTLLQRPSFLSNKFLKFTSQMIFFSQNLLIKLINYGTSQCRNIIFAKKTKISIVFFSRFLIFFSDAVFELGEIQLWISKKFRATFRTKL